MRQGRDLEAIGGKLRVACEQEQDRDASARSSDPAWPTVGVVVPTKDHAELLAECILGLEKTTDYPEFEIVVVDNGSTKKDALALLRDLRVRPRFTVLERPGPFNFSALSNDGASATQASMLVFLNNDIAMLKNDWLKPLVRWAMKPDVGVVGAKLLFPDGRIQHAGVVVGFGGIAGHVYRRAPSDHGGYRDRLAVAHEVTAVTGACIAIERSKFEMVGGFDAKNVAVDLSDIDLCLRIRELGLSNIWTPESVLVHRQSASRGVDADPFVSYRKERTYFARRWLETIRDDPYFHPGLSLFDHSVALA